MHEPDLERPYYEASKTHPRHVEIEACEDQVNEVAFALKNAVEAVKAFEAKLRAAFSFAEVSTTDETYCMDCLDCPQDGMEPVYTNIGALAEVFTSALNAQKDRLEGDWE